MLFWLYMVLLILVVVVLYCAGFCVYMVVTCSRKKISFRTFWILWSIRNKNNRVFKKALSDANLDYRDEYGRSLLFVAIATKTEAEVVRILLDRGLEHECAIEAEVDHRGYFEKIFIRSHMLKYAYNLKCEPEMMLRIIKKTHDINLLESTLVNLESEHAEDQEWPLVDETVKMYLEHRLMSLRGAPRVVIPFSEASAGS